MPTDITLLSLQAAILTVPNRIETHLWINESGRYRRTLAVRRIHSSSSGVWGRNIINVPLSFCRIFELAYSSGDGMQFLSDESSRKARIVLQETY